MANARNTNNGDGADRATAAAARTSANIVALPPEVIKAASEGAQQLGHYILIRELGQGGSGTVYAAWDRHLGRWAAIKVLNHITAESAARFLREAQMASRLSHPHIVPLYEASEADGGRPFLAMKLIHGQQLSRVQLEVKRASAVMRDVADAVQYAHDNGVIHRDLKPQNLMLDEAGHVWILDFGLAHSVDNGSTLTVAGAIVGTPAFMPPEQARGKHCDERSDVYALGATLYALLSGRAPFEGDNALWVMTQVLADDPPPLRSLNERVPKDIETIVQKAMRRDPQQRYARARDFADDLRRHDRGEVVTARPVGAAARLAKTVRRNKVAAVTLAAIVCGVGLFGLGAFRYAKDMEVREQATAEARALAESRLAQASKNLKTAELNRAEGLVEEGNALGAAGDWQSASLRYQAADTIFKGVGEEDPGPNAGMTDVLMRAPPPIWIQPALHSARITELVLNRDETRTYSSSLDGTVKVFDPRNQQVEHTFELNVQVWALALDPSERFLVATTEDGQAVIWDVKTFAEVRKLQQLPTRLRAIAFSPDGRWLTGVYFDGTVVTWAFPEGRVLATWKEATYARSVAYPAFGNGTVTIGLSHDRTGPWAVLRKADTGQKVGALTNNKAFAGVRNIVADRRTGSLYAGFDGGFLIQPKGSQGAHTYASFGHTVGVSLNAAEDLLAVGFLKGAIQVRSLSSPQKVLFSLTEGGGEITRLGRKGRVFSATDKGALQLWAMGTQPSMGRVAEQDNVIGVQSTMAGALVVVEHRGGRFTGVDRATGKNLWTVQLPVPARSFSLPSPQADRLASCDQEGHLRIFALPSGKQLLMIQVDTPVRFLKFSPDSRWLGATFAPGGALFDASTGALMTSFNGELTHRFVAFAPDGSHMATMSGAELVIFDMKAMQVKKRFPYHAGWRATDGFWNAKAGVVMVAFEDQGVVSYDLQTGEEKPLVLSDHVSSQLALAAVSRPVLWLGTLKHQDGELGIDVWDITKKRRVHRFQSSGVAVTEPHLPSDVPLAVSVNDAGEVVVWDLTLPDRFQNRQDEFELAIRKEEKVPSPRTHLALARYFSMRGVDDWAADEFMKFEESAGALRREVTALEYGRALWLGGHIQKALQQYQHALKNGEAPSDYLRLCITALEAELQAGSKAAATPVPKRRTKSQPVRTL
ncbi:MAG: serine/threonine-protein kinase [Deltaproteobacteria bacterium]|nr:serine/threonine-protein kinase [Deltaproteobacteria bacterium]